eukprot:CAMPEP_0117578686 /NCGR_PEP_ID=MMETSP0784-20121206/64163_1 /TAXON_ID=39447 /ORGANISM="" /LENGTH=342 /DNA_ID=CAMNT_0005378421 /DNA_START=38 /DNA_END=1063 /DNA_ORIENTATION=+
MSHGSTIIVECADNEALVPGATETIHCDDGQWSPLVLRCGKDCPPFNTSDVRYQRYAVVSDDLHESGSRIAIGCYGSSGGAQEFLRCEGGAWTRPTLRCFDGCRPFAAGPQYAAMLAGRDLPAGATYLPHGTTAFVTCAEGFSPGGSIAGDALLQSEGTSMDTPIDHAQCIDGLWTALSLQCLPNCPPLSLGPTYSVNGGNGNWVNSTVAVACGWGGPAVRLHCSEHGMWSLEGNRSLDYSRDRQTVEPLASLDAAMPLNVADTFPLDCSEPEKSFWDKLTDDEKAMVLLLSIGFVLFLFGLAHNVYRFEMHRRTSRSTRRDKDLTSILASVGPENGPDLHM